MHKFWTGMMAGLLCGGVFWWARAAPAQEGPEKPLVPGHYVVFEMSYNPASASTKTPSGQMKVDASHFVTDLETLEAKGWVPVQLQITDTVIRVVARGNP